MKSFDDELYLGHILKAARRIVEYTQNMTREAFDADYKRRMLPLDNSKSLARRLSESALAFARNIR